MKVINLLGSEERRIMHFHSGPVRIEINAISWQLFDKKLFLWCYLTGSI